MTYSWRVSSMTTIDVNFTRAVKLANAGEHVSPNPFYNKRKWDAIRAKQESGELQKFDPQNPFV